MDNQFFEHPILNSPYEEPKLHWELDAEGRSTGIPKVLRVMEENGSPAPEFETDEDRTYFLIRLPVHAGAIFPVGTKSELSRDQVTREVTTEVPRKYHGSSTAQGSLWRNDQTAVTSSSQTEE